MKLKVAMLAGLAALLAALAPALATSNYTYGENEYVTVTGGMAPSEAYSIAAHGEGGLALDKFNIFLMKEPGHKAIGPLTEIEEYLDTAADAYTAKWSPDGRAHLVTGPTPLAAAGVEIGPPKETEGDQQEELRLRGFDLEWTSARSFELTEDGRAWLTPDVAAAHSQYGSVTTDRGETGAPERLHELAYVIVADCEIAGADTYRVRNVQPAP